MFNGTDTPDINGVITGFQAMMNFVDAVVTAGSNIQELEYTAFKIRYLCLYTVLASLRRLHVDTRYPLTIESKSILLRILDSPEALIVTDPASKPFRNTLMHYNLNARVDVSMVDVTQPLFGLVPIYFPSYGAATFAELVDRCVKSAAAILNGWAAASR
ncbi:hypothetical protein [Streptomyces sp. NPDC048106]|uniref:hypothetical protein n=1 Tax=Streptomyces sp. NPDC048106 TaxID=3155750 RepID=UPI0034538F5E